MGYAATAVGRIETNAVRASDGEKRRIWEEPGVVEELAKLAATGASAANIARHINETYDVQPPISRCSVIGKCSRVGIPLSIKPPAAPREARKQREPRLALVRNQTLRQRSPVEALLALPSSVPPGGIALPRAHRDSLIMASRIHEAWHQSLVDREHALEEASTSEAAVTIPASTPYPQTSAPYWPETPPKTIQDIDFGKDCSFITARAPDGTSHYCGAAMSENAMCKWHRKLCYMPATKTRN